MRALLDRQPTATSLPPRTWVERNAGRFVSVLIVGYMLTAFWVSGWFPPPNPDEVVNAVASINLASGHGPRYSLYDDLFAPSAYAIRDLSNADGRTLYEAWLALWTKSLPRGVQSIRLSAIAAGAIVLALFYFLGNQLQGPVMGCLLVLATFLNPFFWLASLVVNEYIVLLAVCVGLLGWELRAKETSEWKPVFIGAVAGASFAVHPQIVLFLAGLVSFKMVRQRQIRWRSLGLGLIGLCAGCLLAFNVINVQRYWLYQHLIYGRFAAPPIFLWPWRPLGWLRSWVATLAGTTYYFKTSLVWGWPQGLAGFWAASLVAFIFLMMRHSHQQLLNLRALASGLAVTALGMIVFLKRPEALYALVLFPFLIPLIGYGLAARRPFHWVSSTIGLGLLTGAVLTAHFAWRYASKCQPFPDILQSVNQLAGDQSRKLAGPTVLWLDPMNRPFRDVGAVVVSRYYTEGRWDLRAWLSRWKPDFLVADATFRRVFLESSSPPKSLSQILGRPALKVGVVDTGGAYDRWDVYRIDW